MRIGKINTLIGFTVPPALPVELFVQFWRLTIAESPFFTSTIWPTVIASCVLHEFA